MIRTQLLFVSASLLFCSLAQAQTKPEETEVWSPEVKVVTPGKTNTDAPSDAIILFDGKNLDSWEDNTDTTKPAAWITDGKTLKVNKTSGNIRTKQAFGNYQLHLEWKEPKTLTGSGQGRGNSGLFLASTGPGDDGYELQILDNYNNKTYVNGQAGAVYKQTPPLANACKPDNEWQTYDVMWTAPVFDGDGSLKSPAYVTVIHNGVLVQNHTELKGPTQYIGTPAYRKPHGNSPIKLQAHGDKSEPLSFRNIWIRSLS